MVCSPHEVSAVRKVFKKEIITPGVKLNIKNKDQKRVMSAKMILSDWLVIGRAITAKGDIKKNFSKLIKSFN
mgnify:CR=1 FL=1